MADETNQTNCVLVVDGDVLVRHAIADYLRHCGYVVVEAASTDEALRVLAEGSLGVDAILCDVEAPGSLNGFEFRSQAREQHKDAHLTLVGNIETAAQRAADLCEEGPNLARPYDPQSVVDYIRRVLGGASSQVGLTA